MTTYDGSARWVWPLVTLSFGHVAAALGLVANGYWPLVPIPSDMVSFAACALAISCALSTFLWVYIAIVKPVKRFQQNSHASDALTRPIPSSARGLSGVLNRCALAFSQRLIDLSDADLGDGIETVKLRFNGDAAARLEALANSMEESDNWLRRRQSALTELFAQVAQQAAGAIEEVQALGQVQQQKISDVARCVEETTLAVSSFNELQQQWRSFDLSAIKEAHKRLDINADALTDATAHLLSQADTAQSATSAFNQTISEMRQLRDEMSSLLQRDIDAVQLASSQLRRAGEEASNAAGQVTGLARGGRQAIIRSAKAMLESKGSLNRAETALAEEVGALQAQAQSLINDGQRFNVVVQSLEGAANQMVAQARSAVESQMGALAEASDAHAAMISEESQSLKDFSETTAIARTAMQSLLTTLPNLHGDVTKAIADFKTQLTPLHGEITSAQNTLMAVTLLDVDAARHSLEKVGTFAQALPDIENQLLERQDSPALSRLEAGQSEFLEQLGGLGVEIRAALASSQGELAAIHHLVSDASQAPTLMPELVKQAFGDEFEQLQNTLTEHKQLITSALNDVQAQAEERQSVSHAALKSQLRKLNQDVRALQQDVLAQLKQIKVSQFQSLKQTVRAVPQLVTAKLEESFGQDVKSLQHRLEALITQARKDEHAAHHAGLIEQVQAEGADLADRLTEALKAMQQIETEVVALATAAVTSPQTASESAAFGTLLSDAEAALSAWGGQLDNVATAIALAQDAA